MMYLPAQPKMQATPTHKRPFRETFVSGPRFGGRFFFGAICGWPLVLALGWCNDLWANELRQSCKAKTRAVRF